MSFIGSMVAVGVLGLEAGTLGAIATGAAVTGAAGAGLGAGVSAATGGDPAQGAMMGGIGGLALGAAGPALAPELAASAGAGEAAATVPTSTGSLTAGLTQPGTQGIASLGSGAITPSFESGAAGALPQGFTATGSQIASGITPQGLVNVAPLAPAGGNLGAAGAAPVMSPNLSIGQEAVKSLTGLGAEHPVVQYGGSALQGMATGAGIQGISNAVTGRPITEGMGTSALAGGIGGAATTGLSSQAEAGGALGKVGQFAKANPMITSGGIGLLASPVISGALSGNNNDTPVPKGIKPNFTYNPKVYQPYRFAGGGDIPPSGISTLGGYSDGGQLLKGPGDGVSDNIPAVIGDKEPARLAEGEFVIPARIVSELGNGSTDAGAKQLYAMMDRVQSARHKTMGKGKFSEDTHAARLLPA